MTLPQVVLRERWLEARSRYPAEEKELTCRRDVPDAERRRLPTVWIKKNYVFDGPHGQVPVLELFGECTHLVVQHHLSGPGWGSACPFGMEFTNRSTDALLARLRCCDTAYAMVCRAPSGKIEAYRVGRGWTVPWYSCRRGDFDYDFRVTLDESVPQAGRPGDNAGGLALRLHVPVRPSATDVATRGAGHPAGRRPGHAAGSRKPPPLGPGRDFRRREHVPARCRCHDTGRELGRHRAAARARRDHQPRRVRRSHPPQPVLLT